MKAVVLDVSPEALAHRRRTGIDRWDEMWEGVPHVAPAPFTEHQRIVAEKLTFLLPLLKRRGRGRLTAQINVFLADDNYRIPDLTFIAAGREQIIAEDGTRGGGPDAVIEVRSPQDETYDKFPFFAALGVREVVVVPRDEKKPEVYRLAGKQYLAVTADHEGWVPSEVLGVRFHLEPGLPPRLVIEDVADPATRIEI